MSSTLCNTVDSNSLLIVERFYFAIHRESHVYLHSDSLFRLQTILGKEIIFFLIIVDGFV